MRFLVQVTWADENSIVEVPDDATILNTFYDPSTGALGVAVLSPELVEGEESTQSSAEEG